MNLQTGNLPDLIWAEVERLLGHADPLILGLVQRVTQEFERRICEETDINDQIASELDRVRRQLKASESLDQYREAGPDDIDLADNLNRAQEINERLESEVARLNIELDRMALRNASASIETSQHGEGSAPQAPPVSKDSAPQGVGETAAPEIEPFLVRRTVSPEQHRTVIIQAVKDGCETRAQVIRETGLNETIVTVALRTLTQSGDVVVVKERDRKAVTPTIYGLPKPLPIPEPVVTAVTLQESPKAEIDAPWPEPTVMAPEIRSAVGSIQNGMRRGVPLR